MGYDSQASISPVYYTLKDTDHWWQQHKVVSTMVREDNETNITADLLDDACGGTKFITFVHNHHWTTDKLGFI